MRHKLVFLAIVGNAFALAAGCSQANSENAHTVLHYSPSWFFQPPNVWSYRQDGAGEYEPAFPAAAVVRITSPNSKSDGTLFLMAGRDLDESHVVEQVSTRTTLAVPCCTRFLYGEWIQFNPMYGDFFVLVEEIEAGKLLRVRLFSRSHIYALDGTGAQLNYFFTEFDCTTTRIPYIARLPGSENLGIFVAPTVAGATGADESQVYECWTETWYEGFHSRGHCSVEEVRRLDGRRALWLDTAEWHQ